MHSFTVRIELRGANAAGDTNAGESLQQEMKAQGFASTVKSRRGTLYALPSDEYTFKSKSSRKAMKRARKATKHAGLEAAILVTRGARSFSGLRKAIGAD